ncbi:MAG: hotdog fold thioesterase [Myxococcales bacterium]|nr:MAG: hotdog fold thioesterase [Myxococcales bacterium]
MLSVDPKYELLEKVMTEMIPFNKMLGIEVRSLKKGYAELKIPFRPEFVGDFTKPALHGGVLSALMDVTGGAAVWTVLGANSRVATIDLRVDYLKPGQSLDVFARAQVLRVGGRVGVASVQAFHEEKPEEIIADARGVYVLRRNVENAN